LIDLIERRRHHVVGDADNSRSDVDGKDGDLGALKTAQHGAVGREADADVSERRQRDRQPDRDRVAQNRKVDVEHQKPDQPHIEPTGIVRRYRLDGSERKCSFSGPDLPMRSYYTAR